MRICVHTIAQAHTCTYMHACAQTIHREMTSDTCWIIHNNNYRSIGNIEKKIKTSIKNILIKLKDEVRMTGSKSTQIRVVAIITYTIHPYA